MDITPYLFLLITNLIWSIIMINRAEELKNGVLSFPVQIANLVNPDNDENLNSLMQEFFDTLWTAFLMEKPVDTITWLEEFPPKKFNEMVVHLVKSGWINSIMRNDYCYITLNKEKLLKWVSEDFLSSMKFTTKLTKYRFTRTTSKLSDIVKLNRTRCKTGLVREGFKLCGNHIFYYDTTYIQKYRKGIAFNPQKGLEATTKDISYQEIIQCLLDWYMIDTTEYSLGNCLIDSRGRAIYQCTKKIFNPISSKDARACIKLPVPDYLNKEGWDAVYAFIAELHGYLGKNYRDKVHYGECMYITRSLPSYEDMEASKNYDKLHELIWLERVYANIDSYDTTGWLVPLDIDSTASMCQMTAILTNNHEYMDYTNLINPEEFKDYWTVDYCSRKHVKKAVTPKLYGSSAKPTELWGRAKLEYTQDQLNKINMDINIGRFANANNFKDFVINNVKPKETMSVTINGCTFTIKCNRFQWGVTTPVEYKVYANNKFIRIRQNVCRKPDLEQFKRYFQTLLLHHLDSDVANEVALNCGCWMIPNHDSFITSPSGTSAIRREYTKAMKKIYDNRHEILKEYFKSIGIDKEYHDVDNTEIEEFSGYALK